MSQTPQSAPDVRHDPYAALRTPTFRRFLIGNLVSTIGQQMQTVAIGWELYERTGQAITLGGVGLAQFLPMLLLTLPAGTLADRYDRRRILMLTLGLTTLAAIGLCFVSASHGPVSLVYACLILTGIARGFQMPARQALLPQLVSAERFPNAVKWGSNAFQLSSMLGPALGGLLIAAFHSATPVFAINAVASLLFLGVLSTLVFERFVPSSRGFSLPQVLAGVGFVWRTKIILASISLDMFAVLLGGASALMPVYAKDILQVGARGLGWMEAAPAFGAFLMTLFLTQLPPIEKAGKTLLWAVAGFGLATIGFGVSNWFPLSLLMLGLLGALDSISMVIRSTLVQTLTPEEMRGRVSAVNGIFIGTSNELGGFESGVAAQYLGARIAVVGGGIGTLIVVSTIGWLFPDLRRYGKL
jgi:MFS family permease